MFFLNLSFMEFLAIAGALSGVITLLYFFDRSRRKKTVSTLRFWTDAAGAQQQKRRKSVRQPWSLLLQLLSVLLLLLAIARLQWGSRNTEIRNTALLLDTSSVTSAVTAQGTVLAREKALALQYLSRLNNRDRVMVVRVDGLASPAGPFITDRRQLREEINSSTAGYSALNIERALNYARYALRQAPGSRGEIVYIGPGRVAEPFSGSAPGLRVLDVTPEQANAGVRGILVTRAEGDDVWHAVVTVHNDGPAKRALQLSTSFAGTTFEPRRFVLGPHQDRAVAYQFVANSQGRLDVKLEPGDALLADNTGSLTLPAGRSAKVAVYSTRPEVWRPLLDADKSLSVQYLVPERYNSHSSADVVILDHFAPRNHPDVPSLWFDTPSEGSPLPVESTVTALPVTQWNSDRELGAGLHAHDLVLPRANVFQTFDKDFVVASTAKGPVVVVRPGSENGPKLAVVGFDPLADPLRYRVSSPILFANLMRWLVPQAFRAIQISAESVGLANVDLDTNEGSDNIQVTDDSNRTIPFLVQNHVLQFFVTAPKVVHIVTGQRERSISMILPQIATDQWKVPPDVPRTMPRSSRGEAVAMDLWQILACLGGVALIAEWFLFGRSRPVRFRAGRPSSRRVPVEPSQAEKELVSK